jgi:glyoxylase-like metal-dependent hydrolase (beta-lactamase superfamily II)
MKSPHAFPLVLLLAAVAFPAAADSKKALQTVDRAITAMGGEDALRQVRTMISAVKAQHWEPNSSTITGGDAKFTGDSTIVITRDFAARAARLDWDRVKVGSGGPYKFSEIYSDGVGIVNGFNVGPAARIQQSASTGMHTMSGVRLAAFLRDQHRVSPLLVLDMKADPKALTALPDQAVGGQKLKAVRYEPGRYAFTVLFDPQTGLPARVRTLDTDPHMGDVNYDLVLSDWRAVSGVQVAHRLEWQLGDKTTGKAEIGKVVVNAAVPADRFEIPAEARAKRIQPAMGNVPYQWVERRTIWGNFRDTDELSFNPERIASLELVEIAPGVSLVQGGTHNNMVVEMDKYLVVFDAPIHELQSRWAIDAAKAKYRKPVKYLILSHHHWDHTSGARTFVAEGATVIVGKGNKDYFSRMFSAKNTAQVDELQRKPRKAHIIEVTDKHILSDGKRQVGAYHIENSHSSGTLIGYIPDAKLGFVVDIWSPGRDPLPKKASQAQIELVQGVRKHNLDIERFAGGHGSTGVFRELVAVVEKSAPRSDAGAPVLARAASHRPSGVGVR